jgi:hypothetical protein
MDAQVGRGRFGYGGLQRRDFRRRQRQYFIKCRT